MRGYAPFKAPPKTMGFTSRFERLLLWVLEKTLHRTHILSRLTVTSLERWNREWYQVSSKVSRIRYFDFSSINLPQTHRRNKWVTDISLSHGKHTHYMIQTQKSKFLRLANFLRENEARRKTAYKSCGKLCLDFSMPGIRREMIQFSNNHKWANTLNHVL